jgi:hypothetical protein
MAAVRAATTYCGSTAAAALRWPALPTTRDALDERRLMGTAASDLNTLAGVWGMVGVTLRTRRRENQTPAF